MIGQRADYRRNVSVAFLSEAVHRYAEKHDARVAEQAITVSHEIKVCMYCMKTEEICLVQSPIGAAVSAQVLDTLISCGLQESDCSRLLRSAG